LVKSSSCWRKFQNRDESAQQFFASARLLLQLKSYARIVAVMMPREKWTDERLDDLNKKVDEGFVRVDARFDKVDARFDKVDAQFAKVDERLEKICDRFDALNRTLLSYAVVIIAALIGPHVF
jgi:tetrahydromethanopterin S-methyltransferase subunit G